MAGACAFCGATAALVPTDILDSKWSRRFGSEPVVALDHGWYTTTLGARRFAERLDPTKFFGAHARGVCDFCVHGWVEDVRWRAEPTLLALAQGHAGEISPSETTALARWARLTAMLAELIDGMPQAATAGQRDAVRRSGTPSPAVDCWLFRLRQRLPARVHLSQVSVPAEPDDALVQIVSVDLAHLSALVVLPSSELARRVVAGSGVHDALGAPVPTATRAADALDLSRTRHPHKVALELVCSSRSAARS